MKSSVNEMLRGQFKAVDSKVDSDTNAIQEMALPVKRCSPWELLDGVPELVQKEHYER